MTSERVTVTLPSEIVQDIDSQERNRSKFVLEAVRRELERRRRNLLRKSLRNPHPDTDAVKELGMEEWYGRLPDEDASSLVDRSAGTRVRWVPGEGWLEGEE